MAPDQTNVLQGSPDRTILKAPALAEGHGLTISRRIEQITKGTFEVKLGSLSPASPYGRTRLAVLLLGRIGKQPAA